MSDDIMSMSTEEIIAKYSTPKQEQQWTEVTANERNAIQERFQRQGGEYTSDIMQAALLKGMASQSRQNNPVDSWKGLGGKPGTSTQGRSFADMAGGKK